MKVSVDEKIGEGIVETMLLTLLIFVLLIAGMAVGVIFGRKPIAGSCGGMAALKMDVACDICKGDPEICETEQEKSALASSTSTTDMDYDASQQSTTKNRHN